MKKLIEYFKRLYAKLIYNEVVSELLNEGRQINDLMPFDEFYNDYKNRKIKKHDREK